MPAVFIVLEREVEGLDPYVNGRAISDNQQLLADLSFEAGVTDLFDFYSDNPADVAEFLKAEGIEFDGSSAEAERWFDAKDGLGTVQSLLRLSERLPANVADDLRGFESVLTQAAQAGARWHLAIDF